MREKIFSILVAFCLLAASAAYSAPATPAGGEGGKDKCLACHGPFDKLTAAPKSFAPASGPRINPHMYVPHEKKDAASIPECLNCHKVHPVPLKSKEEQPKANVDWCFSCHHTQEFSACKTCHAGN